MIVGDRGVDEGLDNDPGWRGLEDKEQKTGAMERLDGEVGWRGWMENDSALPGQVNPDVDHVIGHHSQAHPTFDAWKALVAGPIQPMSPFENADAAFAAGYKQIPALIE